ncbi:hypothetical protein TorRG33x02_215550 [Trema orientale]|uniref:Uncharacterized protein n=1 Tax=Trema orientale TaxID=63057 RepID=A0A2P5EAS4_TREOI|nr:hypothetical protein TorRG33x02_215550 [Trema orientale]
MDYVMDAIQRIETAYVKLFEDIRNIEGEIIAFREEFEHRKDAISSSSQFDIRNYTLLDGFQAKPEKVVGVRFKEAAVGGKKSGGSGATMKQGSSCKAVSVTKISPFTLINALQYHEEVTVVNYIFNEDL